MADPSSPALASLDWNDVRFFLAVARGGTLARAANALGVDQTTVGRRLSSLESKLRIALFIRSPSGFRVSAAGAGVLEAAERMEEAALELRAHAAGNEAMTQGTVRVATTESLAEAFLVPALSELRASYPRIHVVVTTGWARVDLRKGDADLAVRLVRPTDPRLACRKLTDFSFRLYASRAFVADRGMPSALDGQPLLAFEDAVRTGARHPFGGLPMERGELVLLTNNHRVLLTAALAGIGIAQLPSYVGDTKPELVRVLPKAEEPCSAWLVVPQANRQIAAVRAVSESIAELFRRRASQPAGASPTRARSPADRSPRTSHRRP